jgi:hypothetical protein
VQWHGRTHFTLSTASGPVSIVFDEHILPYVTGYDHDVLQMALVAERDSCRLLKLLSAEFKDCLLAIGGPQTADLLGVDPGSCSMPFLDLSHFSQRPVEFSLQHISNLPSWTTGTRNAKRSSGDCIIVEHLAGPPYLQGDFKAANPKGAMDFAVSAVLARLGVGQCFPRFRFRQILLAQAVFGRELRFGF